MKTILLAVLTVVVASLTAQAQRFQVPLGIEAVKARFEEITHMTVFITGPSNDTTRRYGAGEELRYTPAMGDLKEVAKDTVSGLRKKLVEISPDGSWTKLHVSDSDISADDTYLLAVYGSGFVTNNSHVLVDASYLVATMRLSWEKEFSFTKRDGEWQIPDEVFDVPDDEFYASEGPYARSRVGIEVGDAVRWFEWRWEWESPHNNWFPSEPIINRTGTDQLCKAGLPPSYWGPWQRNPWGFVYLPPSVLSGATARGIREDLANPFEPDPYLATGRTDIIVLWYDEDRTVGDEWRIGFRQLGEVTYTWRPIGYEPEVSRVKVSKEGSGSLRCSFTGLEPGREYELVATESLSSVADKSAKTDVAVVVADETGTVNYGQEIDRSKSQRFFLLRPKS